MNPLSDAAPAAVTVVTAHGGRFAVDWPSWQPAERAVLCFMRRPGQLLLILKKRGLGAGKFNAPGGRVEPGESEAAAAVRESQEEVGLTPLSPTPAGRLHFAFTDGYRLSCRLFTAASHRGEPTETDEARPFWQDEERMPYHQMWADDRIWMPLLLEGRAFEAWFVFDGDLMLWHELRVQTR